MTAAEALLEYASGGWTDNDRESAQWGSAEQTEAIELSDRGRLHTYVYNYAQRLRINIIYDSSRKYCYFVIITLDETNKCLYQKHHT